MELIEKAPAKVNLSLGVVDKQIDGYHLLEMVNHSISLCDKLTLKPTGQFSFDSNVKELVNPDNLVVKVVKLLSGLSGLRPDFSIYLDKKIPSEAGLAGGSTDAAAAFRLLKRYWNLNIDKEQLRKLALKIGADVPYCLEGGTAYVSGLGEQVIPIKNFYPASALLIIPNLNVSTGEAFNSLDQSETIELPYSPDVIKAIEDRNYHELKNVAKNSFTEVVSKDNPIIGELIERLYKNGAYFATMSGSGSSVIGYFDSQEERNKAEDSFGEFMTIRTEAF